MYNEIYIIENLIDFQRGIRNAEVFLKEKCSINISFEYVYNDFRIASSGCWLWYLPKKTVPNMSPGERHTWNYGWLVPSIYFEIENYFASFIICWTTIENKKYTGFTIVRDEKRFNERAVFEYEISHPRLNYAFYDLFFPFQVPDQLEQQFLIDLQKNPFDLDIWNIFRDQQLESNGNFLDLTDKYIKLLSHSTNEIIAK